MPWTTKFDTGSTPWPALEAWGVGNSAVLQNPTPFIPPDLIMTEALGLQSLCWLDTGCGCLTDA